MSRDDTKLTSAASIPSITVPSSTAFAVVYAEMRAILEAGIEPQELANRLGSVIDIINEDIRKLPHG